MVMVAVGKLHLAYEPAIEQQTRNVTVGRQIGSGKRRPPVTIHRITTSDDERDPSAGRNWWQKDAPDRGAREGRR